MFVCALGLPCVRAVVMCRKGAMLCSFTGTHSHRINSDVWLLLLTDPPGSMTEERAGRKGTAHIAVSLSDPGTEH